jgi:hypothetical protein
LILTSALQKQNIILNWAMFQVVIAIKRLACGTCEEQKKSRTAQGRSGFAM